MNEADMEESNPQEPQFKQLIGHKKQSSNFNDPDRRNERALQSQVHERQGSENTKPTQDFCNHRQGDSAEYTKNFPVNIKSIPTNKNLSNLRKGGKKNKSSHRRHSHKNQCSENREQDLRNHHSQNTSCHINSSNTNELKILEECVLNEMNILDGLLYEPVTNLPLAIIAKQIVKLKFELIKFFASKTKQKLKYILFFKDAEKLCFNVVVKIMIYEQHKNPHNLVREPKITLVDVQTRYTARYGSNSGNVGTVDDKVITHSTMTKRYLKLYDLAYLLCSFQANPNLSFYAVDPA